MRRPASRSRSCGDGRYRPQGRLGYFGGVEPDFFLTPEQEREMRAELEEARREWEEERGIVTEPADFYTKGDIYHEAGIPNWWTIESWVEPEMERFNLDNTNPREIRQELREAGAIKPDGERGPLRVDVLVRILHVLRESEYPLSKKEIIEGVVPHLPAEDDHPLSPASVKRYLRTLMTLGFIRDDGKNRATVYCAGGAKPLRNPPKPTKPRPQYGHALDSREGE